MMSTRYADVEAPNTRTFGWFLEEPVNDEDVTIPMSNAREAFHEWLKNGDGILSIHGKIGSGKSTLMKAICEHNGVKGRLQQWATESDKRLVTANFFFWKTGDPLQRTARGFERGLLTPMIFQMGLKHYCGLIKCTSATSLRFSLTGWMNAKRVCLKWLSSCKNGRFPDRKT